MPYGFTDDPVADFLRHDSEQEKARERCPKCSCCREHIQEDELYDFDGELVCPECVDEYINDNFKKRTSNYID